MAKDRGSNKVEDAVQQSTSSTARPISEMNLVFAEACWLMSRSKAHGHVTMGDMDWLVLPPIILKQARIFRDGKQDPIAFMSWALVSDEVNHRLKSGVQKLEPVDWNSGQHFWIIDLVTPFGEALPILEIVYTLLPADRPHPVLPFGGKDLTSLVGRNRNAPIN